MEAVSVLGRLLLAAVFAVAAAGKLRDRAGTERTLRDFGVPSGGLAVGALALPVVEALIAAGLVAAPTARAAAIAALVLLAAFVGAIERAIRTGRTPDCHCFGQVHSAPVSRRLVARNLVLAAIAAAVAVAQAPSVTGWLGDRSALELSVIAQWVVIAWLAGELTRRRRAPAPAPAPEAPALRPGDPAPLGVALRGDDGAVTLAEALPGNRRAVLAFVEPACGPCVELLPDLVRWREALAERLTIQLLAPSDEARHTLVETHGAGGVLADSEGAAWSEFRVTATPFAVLVAPDGAVERPPASGPLAIEAMVRNALASGGERLATP